MKTGPLFNKLLTCIKKITVCQGGGDAGKTVAILQILAVKAIREPGSVITVEGDDLPNLKRGALRTFQRYVAIDPEVSVYITDYNKSELTYYFKGGSLIEFKSFEDEQDARGSERDYLYMNEANSRPYNMFWQLQRKTRKQVFIDYNPTMRFWAHEKLLDEKTRDTQFAGKVQLYITDHRHNPFLSKEDHDDYESISDPEAFRVYARGMTGRVEGTIYRFKKVGKIPAGLEFGFGIDFGYNHDKCAITKIHHFRRDRYWELLLYMSENEIIDLLIKENSELTPAQYLAQVLKNNGCTTSSLVWGDHDKNYSTQLRRSGIPFRMTRKGPNSVKTGISKVKSFNNYYLDNEFAPILEKEQETYVWDKGIDILTGKEVFLTVPVPGVPDHALDSGRYFIYPHALRFATDGTERAKEEEPADNENE
jgi:phage terminase large subunit